MKIAINDISPFFSINEAPRPAVYRGKAGRFAFLLTEREESGMILLSPKGKTARMGNAEPPESVADEYDEQQRAV